MPRFTGGATRYMSKEEREELEDSTDGWLITAGTPPKKAGTQAKKTATVVRIVISSDDESEMLEGEGGAGGCVGGA